MRPVLLFTATLFALLACQVDSAVSPVTRPTIAHDISFGVLSDAIAASPFHLEFDDFNPCNGQLEHFVFDGTQRLESFDGHDVLHVIGTVTTDDGWVGMFNRQLIRQGDEVTWRFHDMEVGPNAQRQLFTSNLHGTIVDGQIVWTVRNPSLKCVGNPA